MIIRTAKMENLTALTLGFKTDGISNSVLAGLTWFDMVLLFERPPH